VRAPHSNGNIHIVENKEVVRFAMQLAEEEAEKFKAHKAYYKMIELPAIYNFLHCE